MKIYDKKLLIFTVLLFLLSFLGSDAFGQNLLLRSCAGVNPAVRQAKIELTKDGDINLVSCSGRTVLLNGSVLGGTGTVQSVGLALPGIFSVSGSPVTTTGTITATLTSQAQNLVFASPNGAAGSPLFRALVAADIPTLNQNTTGTAASVTGATQNSITSIPNLATVGTITTGTWSGSFGAVSGANLTTLNASNLASGTVATARLGSGTASSSTFLRGDGAWAVVPANTNFTDTVNNWVDTIWTPSTATASRIRYEGRSANFLNSLNSREFQFLDAGTTNVLSIGNSNIVAVVPINSRRTFKGNTSTTTLTPNESGGIFGGNGNVLPGGASSGIEYTFVAAVSQGGSVRMAIPTGQTVYGNGTSYVGSATAYLTVTTNGGFTVVSGGSNDWYLISHSGTLSFTA